MYAPLQKQNKAAAKTSSQSLALANRQSANQTEHLAANLQDSRENQTATKTAHASPGDTGMQPTGGGNHFRHNFADIPIFHRPVRGLQAKLTVNVPGDAYEQEADRVAEQVMRMPDPQVTPTPHVSGRAAGVQRECACGGSCDDCKKKNHNEDHAKVQMKAAGPVNAGGMEAPPIVHEVLRSPGQPLDASTRAFMEPRFGHDFSHVRVHTDEKAAESAKTLGAEAYTMGSHIAFANANSLAYGNNRLLAHELTHTIQQTRLPVLMRPRSSSRDNQNPSEIVNVTRPLQIGHVTSERIALSPVSVHSKFEGMRLGSAIDQDQNKEETISISRELGTAEGYDERLKAIAVARVFKAKFNVVAQSNDGKWHAFEVSGSIPGAYYFEAADTPFITIYPVPGTDQQNRAGTSALSAAEAGNILGIPESEIALDGDYTAGKVNVKKIDAAGRTKVAHGFEAGAPGARYASTISKDQLSNSVGAAGTLYHESTHLKDFELMQKWIDKYREETHRDFTDKPLKAHMASPFQQWLLAKVKSGFLTMEEYELITADATGDKAPAEARAHLRTFLLYLQADEPGLASQELAGYSGEMANHKYGGLATGSPVKKSLENEMKAAYRQMPPKMRQQYHDAMAAALRVDRQAWISELNFR